MSMPAMVMDAPGYSPPGTGGAEARPPRPQADLLAPSVWSDRARLLARPDVVAVELVLLVAVAVLLRQPLTELIGTAAEPLPVPAPAPQPTAPVSPLAVLPVAPPSAARHEPRDPFAPLVAPAQTGQGAPPLPSDTVAAPATGPAAPTTGSPTSGSPTSGSPTTGPAEPAPAPAAATVTIRPGDTLDAVARQHGTTWTVLYEANRGAVGADPDLLRPGTVLVLPAGTS